MMRCPPDGSSPVVSVSTTISRRVLLSRASERRHMYFTSQKRREPLSVLPPQNARAHVYPHPVSAQNMVERVPAIPARARTVAAGTSAGSDTDNTRPTLSLPVSKRRAYQSTPCPAPASASFSTTRPRPATSRMDIFRCSNRGYRCGSRAARPGAIDTPSLTHPLTPLHDIDSVTACFIEPITTARQIMNRDPKPRAHSAPSRIFPYRSNR